VHPEKIVATPMTQCIRRMIYYKQNRCEINMSDHSRDLRSL